ncbi:uncharacterized protein LOC134222398 [Armigeres subalbatus]|uniref:uncharacterized protein LOC134222398 n=1 Tax=Armigeres subalbatus TaxID=124917 RepID=UPI002ED28725
MMFNSSKMPSVYSFSYGSSNASWSRVGLIVGLTDSVEVRQGKKIAREKRQKMEKHCKSIIVSRIHDDQLEHLQGKATPKQMWDGLVKIFERKSVAKRMHLNRQLHELKYTSGLLQEHFVKFDRMIRIIFRRRTEENSKG